MGLSRSHLEAGGVVGEPGDRTSELWPLFSIAGSLVTTDKSQTQLCAQFPL